MKTGLVFDETLEFNKWSKMVPTGLKVYPILKTIYHPAIEGKTIKINLGARLSQRMIPIIYKTDWVPTTVGKDGYVYFSFGNVKMNNLSFYRIPIGQTISNAPLIVARIKEFLDKTKPFIGEVITVDQYHKGIWDPDDHKIRDFIKHLYDVEIKDLNEIILSLTPWNEDELNSIS